jgi:hypothetical protein
VDVTYCGGKDALKMPQGPGNPRKCQKKLGNHLRGAAAAVSDVFSHISFD